MNSQTLARIYQKSEAERARGPLAGQQLGPYSLIDRIGEGGFAEVYKAHDEEKREVAVKILLPQHAETAENRKRFEREAKAIEVQSPYVVQIYKIAQSADGCHPFLVMELVQGKSLRDIFKEKKLSAQEAAKVVHEAALGLAAVHKCGLIHRDIKPANILVQKGSGQAKITDFGQVHHTTDKTLQITRELEMIGSPGYLSPEHFSNKADKRVDIYSLGVVLFEALTDHLPYAGISLLSQLEAKAPPALRLICLKCLEQQPEKRYQTAQELAGALNAFLNGRRRYRAMAKLRLTGKQITRWVRRHPVVTLLAVILALTFGCLVWYGHSSRLNDEVRRADGQATQADEAKRRADDQLYVSRLHAAQVAINDGDSRRAFQLLNECDESRRCYVWHQLLCRITSDSLVLKGHKGLVRSISISSNGHFIATGGADGTVRVWDAATGNQLRLFQGHTKAVNTVSFWPYANSRLFSTSDDGTIRIWEVPEGKVEGEEVPELKELTPWVGAKGPLTGLAFSHTSFNVRFGLVWSSDQEGKIRAWDISSGRILERKGLEHPVIAQLAADADQGLLFSLGRDGSVRLWDAETGQLAKSDSLAPRTVAPSWGFLAVDREPNRTREQNIAVGDAFGRIKVRRRQYESIAEKEWSTPGSVVTTLAWLPDGVSLVTGGENGSVFLWKGGDGLSRQLLIGHPAIITAVAVWAPPGTSEIKLLVSADEDGLVKLTRSIDWRVDIPQPPNWSEFQRYTKDGHCRAVFSKNTVGVLGSQDQELLVLSADGTLRNVGFSPDGKRLVADVDTPNGRVFRAWLTEPTPDEQKE